MTARRARSQRGAAASVAESEGREGEGGDMTRQELLDKLSAIAAECRNSNDEQIRLTGQAIHAILGAIYAEDVADLASVLSAYSSGAIERLTKMRDDEEI